MADRDITIGIRATGAGNAARDIGRVEDSLEELGRQAPRTAEQLEQVADATRELGTGRSGYGSKGNAGSAALEFSRAFEDAQYGIRGVLNNIPSLIFALGGGAGLAGAISIAAVAGSQLWSRLGGGAKKAEEETRDYLEVFEKLKETYGEISKQATEEQTKAGKSAAETLKRTIQGISTEVKIDTDAASLESAKERAEAQLKLVQERIRLAELEKRVATATGNDALRLAQEREAVIRRIYDTELQISEVARKQALAAAEARVAGAGRGLGVTAAAAQTAAQELAAKEAEQTTITEELYRLTRERVTRLQEAQDRLARENEILTSQARESGNYELLADLQRRLPSERDRITESLGKPTNAEIDLAAQAANLDEQLKPFQEQAKAAADAQQAAADAMAEATRALINLKETQDVARRSEAEIKATEAIADVGRNVTEAATSAIAAIQGNAAQQGRAPNLGEQEAIGRIENLISDTTPDAQQGGQLAGLLQSLSNNLTAKDAVLSNGITQILNTARTLASKYQGLADRISELQNQVNQLR